MIIDIDMVKQKYGSIAKAIQKKKAKFLVNRLHEASAELEVGITERARQREIIQYLEDHVTRSSVITESGIGSRILQKDPLSHEVKMGQPVTFVCINDVDYYIFPMKQGMCMEDSRRARINQMQDAIDLAELHYYSEVLNVEEFTRCMREYVSKKEGTPSGEEIIQRSKKIETYSPKDVIDAMGNVFKVNTYQRKFPKIGRNDPCGCGSNKKYKKCCLINV